MSEQTPLQRAIEACGGPAEFARRMGMKPQAVCQWRRVPPKRAIKVAELTGIPLHELRPDIFPEPTA